MGATFVRMAREARSSQTFRCRRGFGRRQAIPHPQGNGDSVEFVHNNRKIWPHVDTLFMLFVYVHGYLINSAQTLFKTICNNMQ